MIAHCLFHQTPARERARCPACDTELHKLVDATWFCSLCLCSKLPIPCVVCTTGLLP